MLITGRREMSDILVVYRIAVRAELLNRGGHIHRVPHDDRIRQEMQTTRLIRLLLLLLTANRALIGLPVATGQDLAVGHVSLGRSVPKSLETLGLPPSGYHLGNPY